MGKHTMTIQELAKALVPVKNPAYAVDIFEEGRRQQLLAGQQHLARQERIKRHKKRLARHALRLHQPFMPTHLL